MTSMVETVARAMFEDDPAYKDSAGNQRHTWDDWPCNDLDPRKYWLNKARTAIAAMRVPTEGMIAAASNQRVTVQIGREAMSGIIGPWPAAEAWQAMIAAALAEKPA